MPGQVLYLPVALSIPTESLRGVDTAYLMEAAKVPYPPGTIRLMGKPGKEMYYIKQDPSAGDAWVYYAKPQGKQAPEKAAAIQAQGTKDKYAATLQAVWSAFPELAGTTPDPATITGDAAAHLDTHAPEWKSVLSAVGAMTPESAAYLSALATAFAAQTKADGKAPPAPVFQPNAAPAAEPAATAPEPAPAPAQEPPMVAPVPELPVVEPVTAAGAAVLTPVTVLTVDPTDAPPPPLPVGTALPEPLPVTPEPLPPESYALPTKAEFSDIATTLWNEVNPGFLAKLASGSTEDLKTVLDGIQAYAPVPIQAMAAHPAETAQALIPLGKAALFVSRVQAFRAGIQGTLGGFIPPTALDPVQRWIRQMDFLTGHSPDFSVNDIIDILLGDPKPEWGGSVEKEITDVLGSNALDDLVQGEQRIQGEDQVIAEYQKAAQGASLTTKFKLFHALLTSVTDTTDPFYSSLTPVQRASLHASGRWYPKVMKVQADLAAAAGLPVGDVMGTAIDALEGVPVWQGPLPPLKNLDVHTPTGMPEVDWQRRLRSLGIGLLDPTAVAAFTGVPAGDVPNEVVTNAAARLIAHFGSGTDAAEDDLKRLGQLYNSGTPKKLVWAAIMSALADPTDVEPFDSETGIGKSFAAAGFERFAMSLPNINAEHAFRKAAFPEGDAEVVSYAAGVGGGAKSEGAYPVAAASDFTAVEYEYLGKPENFPITFQSSEGPLYAPPPPPPPPPLVEPLVEPTPAPAAVDPPATPIVAPKALPLKEKLPVPGVNVQTTAEFQAGLVAWVKEAQKLLPKAPAGELWVKSVLDANYSEDLKGLLGENWRYHLGAATMAAALPDGVKILTSNLLLGDIPLSPAAQKVVPPYLEYLAQASGGSESGSLQMLRKAYGGFLSVPMQTPVFKGEAPMVALQLKPGAENAAAAVATLEGHLGDFAKGSTTPKVLANRVGVQVYRLEGYLAAAYGPHGPALGVIAGLRAVSPEVKSWTQDTPSSKIQAFFQADENEPYYEVLTTLNLEPYLPQKQWALLFQDPSLVGTFHKPAAFAHVQAPEVKKEVPETPAPVETPAPPPPLAPNPEAMVTPYGSFDVTTLAGAHAYHAAMHAKKPKDVAAFLATIHPDVEWDKAPDALPNSPLRTILSVVQVTGMDPAKVLKSFPKLVASLGGIDKFMGYAQAAMTSAPAAPPPPKAAPYSPTASPEPLEPAAPPAPPPAAPSGPGGLDAATKTPAPEPAVSFADFDPLADVAEVTPTEADAVEAEVVSAEEVAYTIPPLDQLTLVPGAGGALAGAGEKDIYEDAAGNRYLFRKAFAKGTKTAEPFRAAVQVLASKLQLLVKPHAPPVEMVTIGGVVGTLQPFAKTPARSTLAAWAGSPHALSAQAKTDVAVEHVLDWMTGQHDSYYDNFIRVKVPGADGTPVSRVVGIDKEQCFKFLGKDKLSADYMPPGNGNPPFYNAFWSSFASGKMDLTPATFAAMSGAIGKLQAVPSNADYTKALKAYTDLLPGGHPNKTEAFIAKALSRRAAMKTDFEGFLTQLHQKRHGVPGSFTFDGGWSPTVAAPAKVPAVTPGVIGPAIPPPKAVPAPTEPAPASAPSVVFTKTPLTIAQKAMMDPDPVYKQVEGWGSQAEDYAAVLTPYLNLNYSKPSDIYSASAHYNFTDAKKASARAALGPRYRELLVTARYLRTVQHMAGKYATKYGVGPTTGNTAARAKVSAFLVALKPADKAVAVPFILAAAAVRRWSGSTAPALNLPYERIEAAQALGLPPNNSAASVLKKYLAGPGYTKLSDNDKLNARLGLANSLLDDTKANAGSDAFLLAAANKLVTAGLGPDEALSLVRTAWVARLQREVNTAAEMSDLADGFQNPLAGYSGPQDEDPNPARNEYKLQAWEKLATSLGKSMGSATELPHPDVIPYLPSGWQAAVGLSHLSKALRKKKPYDVAAAQAILAAAPPAYAEVFSDSLKVFAAQGLVAYADLAEAQASKDEDGEAEARKRLDALHSLATGSPPNLPDMAGAFNAATLAYKGPAQLGGTKPKLLFAAPDGTKYIFKPVDPGEVRHYAGMTAAAFASDLGLPTVPVQAGIFNQDGSPVVGSMQPLQAGTTLSAKAVKSLTPAQQAELLSNRVLDSLLGNDDTKAENFVLGTDGHVYGIDKERSFKHFLQALKGGIPADAGKVADPNYTGTGTPSAYSHLLTAYAKKEIDLDPLAMLPALEAAEALNDVDFTAKLAPLKSAAKLTYGEMEALKAQILARKAEIRPGFEAMFTKLMQQRGDLTAGQTFTFTKAKKRRDVAATLAGLQKAAAMLPAGSTSQADTLTRLAAKALGSLTPAAVANRAAWDGHGTTEFTDSVMKALDEDDVQALKAAYGGTVPLNAARMVAARMLGVAVPPPKFPKGTGGVSALMPPGIGELASYPMPSVDINLPPADYFAEMAKHPAVKAEGMLKIMASPAKRALFESAYTPDFGARYFTGYTLNHLKAKKVNLADAAAVRDAIPSALWAATRVRFHLETAPSIPAEIQAQVVAEVQAAAGAAAPPAPTVTTPAPKAPELPKTKKVLKTLEAIIGEIPTVEQVKPSTADPSMRVIRFKSSVGTAEDARKLIEDMGIAVSTVTPRSSGGWNVIVTASSLTATKEVEVPVEDPKPAPSAKAAPANAESLAGVMGAWAPPPQASNMELLADLESAPMGYGGLALFGDGSSVEGQSMRVRRRIDAKGKTYYTVDFKLRKEMQAGLSTAASVPFSTPAAKYDPTQDALVEGGSDVTWSGFTPATVLGQAKRWAGEGFTVDMLPQSAKPAQRGYTRVTIDPDKGTIEDALRAALDAMRPGLADDILRDQTPEEKEYLLYRRALWARAPHASDFLQLVEEKGPIPLETLKAICQGDEAAFNAVVKALPTYGTYQYGSNTYQDSDFNKARSQLKAQKLSAAEMAALASDEAIVTPVAGYTTHVLKDRWKKLGSPGNRPVAFVQGTSTSGAASSAKVLDQILGVAAPVDDASGGLRGILERGFGGLPNVGGASVEQDNRSGSADSTIGRVWKQSMGSVNTTLYNHGCSLIVSPEVFDRLDGYWHPSDSYGSTPGATYHSSEVDSRTSFEAGFGGASPENEVDFRKGVDRRQIMAVSMGDEESRAGLIDYYRQKGIVEFNGVPLEQFFRVQVSAKEIQQMLKDRGLEVS